MTPDRHAPWLPEIELLIACGRLRLEAGDRARARAAVAAGLDRDRLLRLSTFHGLLPLLYLHVGRGDVELPTDLATELESLAQARTRRNLQLTAELGALLDLCDEQAIPAIPLKGVVLAQQIYGAITLRRVADLDLLVREVDLPRVTRLLAPHGYQADRDTAPADDEFDRHTSHHVTVVNAEKRVRVELHRYLLRPRVRGRWDFDMIAPRLAPAPFMGRHVLMFTPEDLLVYLCEHGAEHSWIRLEWLAAVAELVRSGAVRDWDRVMQWARELGTVRRVHAALLLVSELFGVDVSAAPAVSDRSLRSANQIVINRLVTDPFRPLEAPAERFGYLYRTDPDQLTRLRRCWSTAMAPSAADVELFPLPKVLFPLYGVARPVRLALRRLRRGL